MCVIDCTLDAEAAVGGQFHADGAKAQVQGISLRDFKAAAAVEEGETVVLSPGPSAQQDVRDRMKQRVLPDPRIRPQDDDDTIFDGKRLISGAFFKLFGT